MESSEILNLETRRQLYNCILDNPGLHIRELSRKTKLTYNNLTYHLNCLKKLGFITVQKDNLYHRVYIKDKVGILDKKYINIIQQKIPRRILLIFLMRTACTQKYLSEILEKDPSTINFHLKKLIDIGLIEKAKYENGIVYANRKDKRNVDRTIVKSEIVYTLKDYEMMKIFLLSTKKVYIMIRFSKLYQNMLNI